MRWQATSRLNVEDGDTLRPSVHPARAEDESLPRQVAERFLTHGSLDVPESRALLDGHTQSRHFAVIRSDPPDGFSMPRRGIE